MAATRLDWPSALRQLGAADGYWLATTRPDGRPHLVPVLAVLVDSALHFVTGASTRKGRNLATSPRCVLSARNCELDLVVEGSASVVRDASLREVADEYLAKYAWAVTIRDGAFYGDGAPTAGPPPYDVYRLDPVIAFGFPVDDVYEPARWTFPRVDGDGAS
jgi:hypothetical protein